MLDRLKLIILLTLVPVLGTACSGNASETQSVATQPVATQPVATQPVKNVVKEQPPVLPAKPTGSAFIVVSKRDQTLSVYDLNAAGDTVMVAQFPCCMGKNKGDKQRRGDMRTPESPAGKPFKVTMIQDASTWKHDFKDGRGNIKAYGHWFLRLETPGHKGIGIHGSTNNENTVPGRASEGCIRLLDKDIITLKEHFAYVGMPVTVQPEDQAPLPWEVRARQRKAQ
jgi:lipoprotein-anchoring transpeptidase ErfK/SrfK